MLLKPSGPGADTGSPYPLTLAPDQKGGSCRSNASVSQGTWSRQHRRGPLPLPQGNAQLSAGVRGALAAEQPQQSACAPLRLLLADIAVATAHKILTAAYRDQSACAVQIGRGDAKPDALLILVEPAPGFAAEPA